MSNNSGEVDNSQFTILMQEFKDGFMSAIIIMNKFFSSRFMCMVMTGLCLTNLLIAADLTVRWFNGGYISLNNLILGAMNTLFLLYWWPQAKPHLFRSKQDKESSDVGHTSQA